jgi:thiamine biosynthesis protein ThiS
MKVHVNGRETEVGSGKTIADLVAALGLGERRVAVEVNRDVVTRDAWDRTVVGENDEVEIVQFVGGG